MLVISKQKFHFKHDDGERKFDTVVHASLTPQEVPGWLEDCRHFLSAVDLGFITAFEQATERKTRKPKSNGKAQASGNGAGTETR